MIQNVDTKGNLNLKVKSRHIWGNCCCRFLQIYLIAHLVTNNFQHDTNYVLCPYKIMVDKILLQKFITIFSKNRKILLKSIIFQILISKRLNIPKLTWTYEFIWPWPLTFVSSSSSFFSRRCSACNFCSPRITWTVSCLTSSCSFFNLIYIRIYSLTKQSYWKFSELMERAETGIPYLDRNS